MASTGVQAFTGSNGTDIDTIGWTTDVGDFQIQSNKCQNTGSGNIDRARYTTTQMDSANHYVQATVDADGSERAGISARQASSTFTCYGCRHKGNWGGADGWQLLKMVSGATTTLDSETEAGWGETPVLKLTVDGSTQTALLDSAHQLDGTDSAITSGTYCGIFVQWTSTHKWDDWSAADLAAAAYSIVAGSGSYGVTGTALTPKMGRKVVPGVGSYVLTGTALTPKLGRKVIPEAGSFALTGSDATVKKTSKIIPEPGEYVLTGQTASLIKNSKLIPEAGDYALTGGPIGVYLGREVIPEAGSYSLSGSEATLKKTNIIVPEAGSYALTGGDIGIFKGRTIGIEAGSYILTGQAISLLKTNKLIPEAGSYALTGTALGLYKGRTLGIEAGSYALTGTTLNLLFGREIVPEAGTYTIAGTALSLLLGRKLSPEVGSYTLTGQAASLLRGFKVPVEAGSYVLTGTDLALFLGRKLAIEAGAYVVTGANVTLTYSGAGPKYIYPDPGVYALTGSAVNLLVGRKIVPEAASYALTGTALNMLKGRTLSVDAGNYALTGSALTLLKTNKLTVEAGEYSLGGQDLSLFLGRKISLEADSYILTGSDLTLKAARKIVLDTGSYLITGTELIFVYSAEESIRQRIITAVIARFTALDRSLENVDGYVFWMSSRLGMVKDGSNRVSSIGAFGNATILATQSIDNNKPLYEASVHGSCPGITFDGINDYLIANDLLQYFSGTDKPYTLFVAFKHNIAVIEGVEQMILGLGNSTSGITSNLWQIIRIDRLGNVGHVKRDSSGAIAQIYPYPATKLVDNTNYVLRSMTKASGTKHSLYVNGVVDSNDNQVNFNVGNTVLDRAYIGCGFHIAEQYFPFRSKIEELIIYPTELSDADAEQEEAYINARIAGGLSYRQQIADAVKARFGLL